MTCDAWRRNLNFYIATQNTKDKKKNRKLQSTRWVTPIEVDLRRSDPMGAINKTQSIYPFRIKTG
jgi:hypothetical protein